MIRYVTFALLTATGAYADCGPREQVRALALNMYHEARGEGLDGMLLVGEVTLYRVENEHFPDTVCDVVYQARTKRNGEPIRNRCQFSWYCNGRSNEPREELAWERAKRLARELLNGSAETVGIEATHYHTTDVEPHWSDEYELVGRYGRHLFYHMGDRL
jgi:N-acetylmuramoyl-L-alanine amidase